MKKPAVPFFVRFLEGQESLQVRTDVKAGGGGALGGGRPPFVKRMYPSDDDEGGATR
jgi:hypothetical protein